MKIEHSGKTDRRGLLNGDLCSAKNRDHYQCAHNARTESGNVLRAQTKFNARIGKQDSIHEVTRTKIKLGHKKLALPCRPRGVQSRNYREGSPPFRALRARRSGHHGERKEPSKQKRQKTLRGCPHGTECTRKIPEIPRPAICASRCTQADNV